MTPLLQHEQQQRARGDVVDRAEAAAEVLVGEVGESAPRRAARKSKSKSKRKTASE